MNRFWVFAALLLLGTACEKIEDGTPPCICKKINRLKQSDARAVARVYAGDTVYYHFYKQSCCDKPTELYDAECNLVCGPSGGFSGRGSGDCPAGIDYRNSEVIWER